MSAADAQAVEQVLIENFGLAKNGGTVLNRINSIESTNLILGPVLTGHRL
jgi:filamentous hemagglutinin